MGLIPSAMARNESWIDSWSSTADAAALDDSSLVIQPLDSKVVPLGYNVAALVRTSRATRPSYLILYR